VLAGAAIIRGNVAGHSGGGVSLLGLSEDNPTRLFTAGGGTLTVEGNWAQSGGGIATWEFVAVDLVGAAFFGNAAEQNGGALAMSTGGSTIVLGGGVLARNVAGWGGGAFVFGATLSLRGTAILDNTALLAGGAVAAYSAATVSLAASRLANNSAAPPGGEVARCKGRCGGGAVFAADAAVLLLLDGTVMEDNKALFGDGGGILAADSARLEVRGGAVRANKASGFGGGIAATGEATLDLGGGLRVELNTAGGGGGGVFASGGAAQLGAVTVQGNSAGSGVGGGVLALNEIAVTAAVAVDGNEAALGGGVYASGKLARLVVRVGGALAVGSNSAREDGGGVYLEDSADYMLESEPCPASCPSFARGDRQCDVEWCAARAASHIDCAAHHLACSLGR
jgi:predicted outer membrane repeat protein